ncbi:MAG TPA: PRC-barrel domain-containing protein [Candidatus Nanoarchaeia archaeon]|nr:PRC-barrel domain-containing protein [Candidatus Nanoarchaeia archaeon]
MFERKIEVLSSRTKKLEGTGKFSSYIGKRVYSKTGELVGSVYDIIIKKDCMIGVLYKKNSRVFIGKEFFKSDTADAIMLKIDPVTDLIGKQVYDSTGKRIGKVVELKRKSTANSYEELRVKKAFYLSSVFIPKKLIAVAKKNIILKEPWGKKK